MSLPPAPPKREPPACGGLSEYWELPVNPDYMVRLVRKMRTMTTIIRIAPMAMMR